MRPLRISENFVPVSEFKAQAADWLRKIDKTGVPLIITQNGKPAGVFLSPAAFDALTERARFLTAVNEGLAEADEGFVLPHAEVAKRMKERFGANRK